jgi:hypothetical protein
VSVTGIFRNDGKQPLEFHDTYLRIAKLVDSSGDADSEERKLRIEPKYVNDKGEINVMPLRTLEISTARRISFLVPSLRPGSYLVQIDSLFKGLTYSKGIWSESSDDWVLAVEQGIIFVPNAAAPSIF